MATYVQLGAVKTWYDEHGEGDPLVLLHGGLVDARFFDPNLPALAEHFHVYTPERRGHGHTPDVEGPITYQLMTDDTIAFLESVVGQPADLVGHSDGAFVAMLVAMQRPELMKRLVMISGGFSKAGEAAPDAEWTSRRSPSSWAPPTARSPLMASTTSRWWRPRSARWPPSSRTWTSLSWPRVTCRSLVMFADDDLVTPQHMVDMYAALPNAELAIVPGTSHFLTQEKPELVNKIVVDFLTREPVATVAPIRRAPKPETSPG
jgi:pimeloyl-ACP methyl ester carboxylesterase